MALTDTAPATEATTTLGDDAISGPSGGRKRLRVGPRLDGPSGRRTDLRGDGAARRRDRSGDDRHRVPRHRRRRDLRVRGSSPGSPPTTVWRCSSTCSPCSWASGSSWCPARSARRRSRSPGRLPPRRGGFVCRRVPLGRRRDLRRVLRRVQRDLTRLGNVAVGAALVALVLAVDLRRHHRADVPPDGHGPRRRAVLRLLDAGGVGALGRHPAVGRHPHHARPHHPGQPGHAAQRHLRGRPELAAAPAGRLRDGHPHPRDRARLRRAPRRRGPPHARRAPHDDRRLRLPLLRGLGPERGARSTRSSGSASPSSSPCRCSASSVGCSTRSAPESGCGWSRPSRSAWCPCSCCSWAA